MKKSVIPGILILSLTIIGCSWISRFYIINQTDKKLIVSYKLRTTPEDESYALEESVIFFPLNKVEKKERKLIGEKRNGKYSREVENGAEYYTVLVNPSSAISGGSGIANFKFEDFYERHRIFKNIIEMTIIREDTQDTVFLNPALLADFSRPFGKCDIALIFD